MNDKPAGHPIEWFDHLYRTDQWERLLSATGENLSINPDDSRAHYYRAWALMFLKRLPEARIHVDWLLRDDPEDIQSLEVAARWHLKSKDFGMARTLISQAIELSPRDANLYFTAAIILSEANDNHLAKVCAARARALNPDDSSIAHLHIALHQVGQESATGAWRTIRAYEETLRLDPENDALIAAIGDVYLEQLEQPRQAELHYRQALGISPASKLHQQRLWLAIQQRSLLFRTLRLPYSAARLAVLMSADLGKQPGCIIGLVLGFKVAMIGVCWLLASFIIFTPAALLYEWLVLLDIRHAARVPSRAARFIFWLCRVPFSLRFAMCALLIAGFWWGLFAILGADSPSAGLKVVGGFFALHFLLVTVVVAIRKWRSRQGQKDAQQIGPLLVPSLESAFSQRALPPPLPLSKPVAPPPLPPGAR